MEVYNLNLVYYGIVRTFTCSLSDESEETAEDKQQDNPVENDSFEDEPSTDTAEERDSGI